MQVDFFLKKYGKAILTLLAAITGFLFMFLAWELYQLYANNPDRTRADFAAAEAIYQQEQDEHEKRIEPLRKALSDQLAQNPQLAKTLEDMQAGHDSSTKAFVDTHAKHKASSPQGFAAGLKAAGLLLEKKDYEQARPILQDLQAHCKTPVLCQQIDLSLALTLAALNNPAEALEVIEKLLARDNSSLDDEILSNIMFIKAEIAFESERKDLAKETAQYILDNFKSTPAAKKARALIAYLEVQ